MRKLIIITLLILAFLWGYYLGLKPEAPDIFAWAGKNYDQAADVGKKLSAFVNGKEVNALDTVGTQEGTININGKTYLIRNSQMPDEAY